MENNNPIFVDLFAKPTVEESLKEASTMLKAQYDSFIKAGFSEKQALFLIGEIFRAVITQGK